MVIVKYYFFGLLYKMHMWEVGVRKRTLKRIWMRDFQVTPMEISLTRHLYSPAFLIIDETQFQKLPAEIRDALVRHAEAIEDCVLMRGEELDAIWLQRVRETMAVNEADRFAFTLQALPIYREFASRVPTGKAMMRLVFEADPEPFVTSTE